MIKVSVFKQEDCYQMIEIKGHALYDDYGKDIVCSAVSSIVTTSINGILSLDEEALSYEVLKDGLLIHKIKPDSTTQILLNNMINLLQELAQSYPNNVKIK